MIWPESKLSLRQERLTYRRAVIRVLIEFLHQDESSAESVVAEWWQRMEGTAIFTKGIFLHDEPINTAADLIGLERTPAVSELGTKYFEVLTDALPKHRSKQRTMFQDQIKKVDRAA